MSKRHGNFTTELFRRIQNVEGKRADICRQDISQQDIFQGTFLYISYYKRKLSGSRGRARRALTKRVKLRIVSIYKSERNPNEKNFKSASISSS